MEYNHVIFVYATEKHYLVKLNWEQLFYSHIISEQIKASL